MSQEMNIVIMPGATTAHEYLRFDRKPNDPNVVKDLQFLCKYFSEAAAHGASVSVTLTVDGSECSMEEMNRFHEAVAAMSEAENFAMDVSYADLFAVPYEGLFAYMEQYMETEKFTCKKAESVPNYDSLWADKIVNGVHVDVFAGETDNGLKTRCTDWQCAQMSVGVDFDTDFYAAKAEALREIARRHLSDEDFTYLQDMWEERAEENEQTVDLLYSSYWSDLSALDAYFAEVNEVIALLDVDMWYDRDTWYSMKDFAVAKLVCDRQGFHIVTNLF
ncbi:MAG: hypothetical protein IIV43_07170 [Oscillospiraceae bacterium]|nr:hypothetical protein [Oscillospiraceae bacterium]